MSDTTAFWSGEFGNEYVKRNQPNWRERLPFWEHIVEATGARRFLDVGCNAGFNLHALRQINPEFEMSGVDVNRSALEMAQAAGFDVQESSATKLVELFGQGCADLVITSGVLIHVGPDELREVMEAIRDASAQYVIAIEYEASEPQEVNYRGHEGKLWRRPFGKLYEELGLSLVETGVAQGFDQCHYWLMEVHS